ncbi:MAG TPA: YHYH protein, partial [Kiritimatiellia bacterium]
TDYFWHANAPINESYNFDFAMGHQPPSGVHHTHQNPIGLRYQLGDHVDLVTVSTNKFYQESTNPVTAHSPILGWSLDGYPIYGPYGYSNPTNPASGVRRMVSGYVLRDGTNTTHVTNNLSTIPAWYSRFRQDLGAAYTTSAVDARHSVGSGTNHGLGFYAQDWEYQGDLGRTQGVTTNFDLDEYNGRTCKTPDFTNSTYAYFVTLGETNGPTYPYVFAFQYYGTKGGATGASVPPNVTTNFVGGANVAQEFAAPVVTTTNSTVTLVWRAAEGGQYIVESSSDLQTWTEFTSSVNAAFNSGVVTRTVSSQEFYRVTRTNLAVYEP